MTRDPIEAIYFACTLKPLRASRLADLVRSNLAILAPADDIAGEVTDVLAHEL